MCVRASLRIGTLRTVKTKWLFVRKLYIFGLLEFYKYRSRSEQSELVCRIRINNYGRIRVGYLILSENCHQYVKERHKPWIGKTCCLVNVLKCMFRFLEMCRYRMVVKNYFYSAVRIRIRIRSILFGNATLIFWFLKVGSGFENYADPIGSDSASLINTLA